MHRVGFFVLLVGLSLAIGGCKRTKPAETIQNVESKPAAKPGEGLIDFIKGQKLVDYKSKTIGKALESYKYLDKKEWKVKQEGRNFTVTFLGWFDPSVVKEEEKKTGIAGKGLEVIFVVNPDGSFYAFMTSMIEATADNKLYRKPLPDSGQVFNKIYNNDRMDL